MQALPSHLIKLRVLALVPRAEYLGLTAKNVDFSDTNARHGFLGLLRKHKVDKPQMAVSSKKLTAKAKTVPFEFNAALWLNFSCPPKQPVSFWLSYKDAGGCKSVLIDEQTLENTTSTMLSGTAKFDVQGEFEYLKACCGGVSDEEMFSIDELYVQSITSGAASTGLKKNLA